MSCLYLCNQSRLNRFWFYFWENINLILWPFNDTLTCLWIYSRNSFESILFGIERWRNEREVECPQRKDLRKRCYSVSNGFQWVMQWDLRSSRPTRCIRRFVRVEYESDTQMCDRELTHIEYRDDRRVMRGVRVLRVACEQNLWAEGQTT